MNRVMNAASRKLIGGLAICGAIIFSLAPNFVAEAGAADHAYVGESQCEDCHGAKEAAKNFIGPNGSPNNPVAVWQQDPHHKSFEGMSDEWGKKAAAKAHVSDPAAEDSMCLKCHTTGHGKDGAPDPSEGVSCEGCHGAAADYVKKSVHGEINDDAGKMQVAVAAGLIDMRKVDVREKNCRGCHVTERPCLKPGEKAFDVKNDSKFRHWRNTIPPI